MKNKQKQDTNRLNRTVTLIRSYYDNLAIENELIISREPKNWFDRAICDTMDSVFVFLFLAFF